MGAPGADEYLAHFEQSLGVVSSSWRKSDETTEHFQILQFFDKRSDWLTYATFGLTKYDLVIDEDRPSRQELVLGLERSCERPEVPGLLNSIGESVVHRGRALLRGEVLGPHGPVFDGLNFTAFYCSLPVYFPAEFEAFTGTTPETIMVWLVPIFSEEAEYVHARGWSAFEDLLVDQDPNLMDLSRSPLKM